MAETKMELADWFDELCARFIINLPQEELESVERICFQVEEAQWFYEDFIRPLDPTLPSLKLKEFCLLIFRHCPILSGFQPWQHVAAYEEFLSYKNRVPVRGAIMLNEEMDQVVLVKGWKKGARWSFPRGKINKDEPDLECAIREVDEETGFDIQQANLVKDGENTKYIQVTMREQHMRLYVFRGVPMTTYFEPKTRKEISKIAWWRLSDLPTVTRRGQQINEEDTVKANQFYMVAPFLGPLKSWIKDQRRRDRKRMAQANNNSASGIEYFTETEDATRREEKSHMNRLMDDLRRSQINDRSSNLPEVSSLHQPGGLDNAAMLKGLLGVGAPAGVSTGVPSGVPVGPPAGAPQPAAPPANMGQPDLMSLLLGTQPSVPSGAPLNGAIPHTPLDQVATGLPQQPPSPSHHHLRQPHFENQPPVFSNPGDPKFMPRAPPIPRGSQPQPMGSQHPPGPPGPPGILPQQMPGFQPHQPPQPPQPSLPSQTPWFPGPSGHAGGLDASRLLGERGDSFYNPGQAGHFQSSAVPPASKLPAPKNLSQQAMGLLNAFKSDAPARPPPTGHRSTKSQSGSNLPQVVSSRDSASNKPSRKNHELDIASLLKDDKKEDVGKRPDLPSSQPSFTSEKSVPPQAQLLLDLFRRPGATAMSMAIEKDAGPLSPKPVELSAMASPGVTPKAKHFHSRDVANDKTNLFVAHTQNRSPSSGRPSATVSGPLNAPDFEILHNQSRSRRNTALKHEGSAMPSKLPPQVLPVSILARPKPSASESPSKSPPVPVHSVSPKTKLEAPKPFHPQILKRGQALAASPPAVTIPGVSTQSNGKLAQDSANDGHTPFDRRDSQPNDQKSTLLSLFGKPSPPQPKASVDDNLPAAPSVPHPNMGTSHVVSPVSPLPEKILQTPRATPPEFAKTSRISSITSNPSSAVDAIKDNLMRSYEARPNSSGIAGGSYFSPPKKVGMESSGAYPAQPGASAMHSRPQPQSHPSQQSLGGSKDRDFLLGYLQNVGKKGS